MEEEFGSVVVSQCEDGKNVSDILRWSKAEVNRVSCCKFRLVDAFRDANLKLGKNCHLSFDESRAPIKLWRRDLGGCGYPTTLPWEVFIKYYSSC